ncbi:MAG TPA: manganese efflux pump MntP family protein [Allosphingosinicella sp.]|jgi:putative Mn2+ efflux pump MntP|nr:manganese efflux pump MntP family protein [Allosphingosinicella sp.]
MTALLLLALALSMDAFAAALAQGAAGVGRGAALRIGAAFGFAQGAMPLLGWALGLAFASMLSAVDHWVALVLLSLLGLRMMREALSDDSDGGGTRRLAGWALFTAALATSVDAAAAGITLPTIGVPILVSVAVIGATTALLSYGGVLAGRAAGQKLGRYAEAAGGLILIGIGVKIFIEHQFLGG